MCRRQHLLGCLFMGFGLGLLVAHCIGSGFLCICGGTALVITGICAARRK